MLGRMMVGIAMVGAIVGTNGRATTNGVVYIAGQCSNNEECDPGECCVLGGNRYSIPQCSPMLEDGATCRPNDSRLNSTLVYPDGNRISLRDVYFVNCPCTFGLSCDAEEGGVCRDRTQKRGFNHLLNEASAQDD